MTITTNPTTKQLTINVNMVQHRIATGMMQDDQTTLYLVDGEYGPEIRDVQDDYLPTIAIVHVTHPSILAGTWEDFLSDVRSTVVAELLATGQAKANKYGYIWIV